MVIHFIGKTVRLTITFKPFSTTEERTKDGYKITHLDGININLMLSLDYSSQSYLELLLR